MQAGVDSLFVYGTLRSDFPGPFARRLREACGKPVMGRVPGRIFDLGEYPGMIESDRGGDLVLGEVYRLPADSEELLAELDEYEDVPGGLYVRRVLTAELVDGGQLPVYAYIHRLHPTGFSWIPGGDYVAYLRRKRQG